MQQGFAIKNDEEKAALKNVKALTGFYGRWDVISQQPTIILDVAHNEDGIKQLLQQLALVKHESSVLHLVMGMVRDKDIAKVLSILPKEARYYFSNAHITRALPHGELKERASAFGLYGESFDDVNEALRSAKKNADAGDLVIVCGSVFLVAEAEPSLLN
jgi:dihydrofolate synthase/folylpolyglutamate synthase